jgi:hypothetical protein
MNGVGGYDQNFGDWSGDVAGLRTVYAGCSGSRVVMGGGFETRAAYDPTDVVIVKSFPYDHQTWEIQAISADHGFEVRAWAICALSH